MATTVEASDDPVASLCEREGILYWRGSENDVLQRFIGAARWFGIDLIVRSTADDMKIQHWRP